MRQTNSKLLVEQKPLGVIDVLTAGFEIVRKRPWTIVIPVLLDLSLWLLPRLSLSSLFRFSLNGFFDTSDATPDAAASAEQMRLAAAQFIESLNILGLVASALNSVARLPSLLALDTLDLHSPINALAFTIPIESGVFALFLLVPLFFLGLLLAAVYIEAVAQGVRPLENAPRLAWLPRVGTLWLRLIVFSLVLGAILFALGLVVLIAQSFGPLGGEIGSFILGIVAVGWFWIAIYLFFTVSALALNQAGLVEAIRRSIFLFRAHFWSAIVLVVLVVFLDRGLSLLWHGLTVTPVGVILAIAANAYIGTSLLAATMVFYQDRMIWMEKIRARARPVGRVK